MSSTGKPPSGGSANDVGQGVGAAHGRAPLASRAKLGIAAAVVAAVLTGTVAAVPGLWEHLYYGAQGFTVGAPTQTWTFTDTLDDSGRGLRVAVVGDPGTGDADEYAVTGALAAQHKSHPYEALLLLGDLVYPDGDLDMLDETIVDPFAPLLDEDVTLLPVLGNHDYQNGESTAIMKRLGRDSTWFAHEEGPVLFVVLDSNIVDDPAQTRWLEQTLDASAKTWTIVAMHHPAYSAGVHGSDLRVREEWSAVFSRYGVDLVLAGHDHDYQRSEVINGVVYVVSGAGAKTRPTGDSDVTAFSASTLHYLDLQITKDQIFGQAVDTEGRSFDRFTIRRGT